MKTIPMKVLELLQSKQGAMVSKDEVINVMYGEFHPYIRDLYTKRQTNRHVGDVIYRARKLLPKGFQIKSIIGKHTWNGIIGYIYTGITGGTR
jgi:hypothetical protein